MSTYTPFAKRSHQDERAEQQLSFVSLNLDHDLDSGAEEELIAAKTADEHEHEHDSFDADVDDDDVDDEDDKKRTLPVYESNNLHAGISKETSSTSLEQHNEQDAQQQESGGEEQQDEEGEITNDENISAAATHDESAADDVDHKSSVLGEDQQVKHLHVPAIAAPSHAEVPTVEVRLKQISQEIEKLAAASNENQRHNNPAAGVLHHDNNDVDHQSFLSLTDLIRTLRPNNKQIIPQIDSDYSNAMRVLGETSEVANNEEAHKF